MEIKLGKQEWLHLLSGLGTTVTDELKRACPFMGTGTTSEVAEKVLIVEIFEDEKIVAKLNGGPVDGKEIITITKMVLDLLETNRKG